jgi:LysM repeat protein
MQVKIKSSLLSFLILTILSFCIGEAGLRGQTKSNNIQTVDGKKYIIHTIEKGQSLYSISKLYAVSLDEIYKLNPDSKNGTKAGQEIKIPFVATNLQSSNTNTMLVESGNIKTNLDTSHYFYHKVSKGESLYSILRKYNKSEKDLSAINPNFNNNLKDGQIILLEKKQNKTAGDIVITNTIVSSNQNTIQTKTNIETANLLLKEPKSSYNLALILPFKFNSINDLDLNELVKNKSNFPSVSSLAADFYIGFKRAVDSLTAANFELNLEIYDIDDKDSLKVVGFLNDPSFKKFDMIFGPLYTNSFRLISQKAKENGIPIISPIAQQNKMLYNNVYASKTNPSQFTLLENLADYIIDSLYTSPLSVVVIAPYEKDAKEVAYYKGFRKYYSEKLKSAGKSDKDSLLTAKGIAGAKQVYKPGAKNIYVTFSANQVFLADFTTQLAIFSDKKDISLCGWQTISVAENVDQEYLNQLRYFFPHQYNTLNTASYGYLNDYYRSLQNVNPSEYFYIGFDLGLFYLKNLKEKGPNFVHELNNCTTELNYTRYKFARPDAQTGFDNRGVYIFIYSNYKLIKTGWK